MARIWLRNVQLSATTDGDLIDTVRDNGPELREKFGLPDLTDAAQVQAACKAWYPTKLRGQDLAGYEVTPVDVRDREAKTNDVVFAPVGAHAPGDPFKPSTRRKTRARVR